MSRKSLPILMFVLASSARAIVPHEPELTPEGKAMLAERPIAAVDVEPAATAAWAASDPAWQSFLATHPGTWHPRFDRRSGRLSFAWGEGFAWLSGDFRVATEADRSKTLDVLEAKARGFIASNAGLYRLPPGVDLVRDTFRSGEIENGRVWYLRFRAVVRGVPVDGTAAYFHLSHGRVVQFGIGAVTDLMASAPTTPLVTERDADDRARIALASAVGMPGAEAKVTAVDDPRTYLLPVQADGGTGKGFAWRLVREQSYRVPGRLETWTIVHDAVTGERVAFFDRNRYACTPPSQLQGRVTGGVWMGPIEEVGETIRPMPYARVDNGVPVAADFNGIYVPVDPSAPVSTSLSGTTFDMACDTCSNPSQAFVAAPGWSNLDLGVGGLDEVGNGRSTRAERNCFYHLNLTRALARGHLTDAQTNGFLSRTTPATVNIDSACNAFWDGSGVNFFRSSGGCNNTGEIADVMQHEWGHGLDQFTGGGNDGARGEGFSDVNAFMAMHDPRLGPYFNRGNANGIRTADENGWDGLYTRSNLGTHCPGGGGPLGFEYHCEGVLSSQTWWHLARNLRVKYGEAAGWYAAQRLFYAHLPISHWSVYAGVPAGETVQYDGVLLIDDDDGNLGTGVPDGAEINDAFVHHEIEGTPLVLDSPECTPPGVPTLTLTPAQVPATGLWQVHVSWSAVPGVVQYRVMRNDTSPDGSFVEIAQVAAPATEFFDDSVTEGLTYHYRLQTFDAAGCASVADDTQAVVVGGFVGLGLAAAWIDDSVPTGNANFVPEPGETVRVLVSVHDGSLLPVTNVVATITTSYPGVTVVDGTADVGTVAPDATVEIQAPYFLVRFDPSVVCGAEVPFFVQLEAAETCGFGAFGLVMGIASPAAWVDDFETDRGWLRVMPPRGGPEASAGLWERADPNGTAAQLEDDHTPGSGTQCWVTGAAGGAVGADDVDDGCTTVLSPVIDLGGRSGLLLEYWRYYDIERSLDDELVFEISGDGGSNWSTLETISAPLQPWQLASFDLDTVLGGPAGRVRLRVTACDEGTTMAERSLVEAMFDDVIFRSRGNVCELPASRPRLRYVDASVGDSAAFGGLGNGDGILDPGESVRIPVQLENRGNETATNVRGTMILDAAPSGVSLSDATSTWPDIPVSMTLGTDGAPPHFQLTLSPSLACGGIVRLTLHVDYDGPSGSYALDQAITLEIGQDVDTPFWSDDFETSDNGFTHGLVAPGCSDACVNSGNPLGCDDWMRLAPCPNSATDPPAAHGGTVMWSNDPGCDVGGNPFNGDYRPGTCNYLESPPIDCTGRTSVHLTFWRWLAVEAGGFDDARIVVNGSVIWSALGEPSPFVDTAWTQVDFDVSAIADGNPAVVVRFELESDPGLELGGWNVDDMALVERRRVCTPFDPGTCVSPPTPGPVGPWLRATPSYSETSAEFTWIGAPLGAGESYVLQRTTGFRPAPAWLDITPPGFTGTTFDDAAAPGALYFYRVLLANCLGQLGPDDGP